MVRRPFRESFDKSLPALVLVVLFCVAGAASGQGLTVLHNFAGGPTEGSGPYASLIEGPDGNFYGTTLLGGSGVPEQVGTVFKITPGGTLTTLHSFTDDEGHAPFANLVLGNDGNFYGTTPIGPFPPAPEGFGTFFKITSGGTLTTLYTFMNLADDGAPNAIILAGDGNFYGTTVGAAAGRGTVFVVTPAGGLSTLYTFGLIPPQLDGIFPKGGMVDGLDGYFYGTNTNAGANGWGTVFKITPQGALTTLHTFDGINDGGAPWGALIRANDGNFYGTTLAGVGGGGPTAVGTVFRITPQGNLTTLHAFHGGSDGCTPRGGVIQASDGNFYGTTEGCGTSGVGTLFQLTPAGDLTVFYFFPGWISASPEAALLQASDGNLYGTTFGGGVGMGTVFKADLPPSVLSITPTSGLGPQTRGSGPAAGGVAITIGGTTYVAGATVSIGGVAATGVNVVGPTQITATTPALPAGTLNDVTVTNPDTFPGTMHKAWFADFLDVPQADIFHSYVEKLIRNGITAGCGGGNYCRNNPVTRAQMAVFLLKAEHGSGYKPPFCTGIFPDVPCTPGTGFPDWIEELSAEGITGGCGGGNYCPGNPVTRQQMAVFLLKTEHGSSYTPPACAGIFGDVGCPSQFADWIEQLYAENVTGGCQSSPLLYCPGSSVTRGQMSAFLTKTFNLP